jgi:hypothetical protein
MSLKQLITSCAAVGLVVGSTMTLAAVPAAQAALPQGNGDLTAFAIDGDTAGPNDWDAPYGPGMTPQGNRTTGLRGQPFRTADACGSGVKEDAVVPGTGLSQVVIEDLPGLVTTANVLDKGDLCGVYLASELVEVGGAYNTILYGAWDRDAAKRGEVFVHFTLADDVPGNSAGDRLVEFNYDDSDNSVAVFLRSWDGTAWVRGSQLPESVIQAATNGASGRPATFGEFALDLTESGVLPPSGPCRTVLAGPVITETSESDRATLKDYVGPTSLPSVTNCATLVVEKVANPQPQAATSFGFEVTRSGDFPVRPGQPTLSGALQVPSEAVTYPIDLSEPTPGNPVTITDVLAGPDFAVAESSLPPNWTQQTVVCTGIDPMTGEPFTRTLFDAGEQEVDLEFPVGPGLTATCTITNLGPPAVQLTKSVLPAGATDWTFSFTISPARGLTPSQATQSVTAADPTIRWDNLTPGEPYTITETPRAGWQAGPIVCGSGQGAGSTFSAEPGQLISCTASNTQLASVTVVKDAAPADDTPFAFTGTGLGAEGATASFDLRDPGAPSTTFADLVPGQTHTITEVLTEAQVAAGWLLGDVTCVDALDDSEVGVLNGSAVAVTTRPGSDITCRFTNTKLASVSVTKSVNPTTATGWTVGFTISPVPAGEAPTKSANAGAPTVSWAGLVPGTQYTVTEGAMPGFTSGALTCGTGGSAFTPAAGEVVACRVTNTQLASASVTKTVNPSTATGWRVEFTISPVPAGETGTKAATSAAPTVAWAGLVPGTAYTVSEGAMPGFAPGALTCGSGGAAFTPTPGQAVSCAVTNTQLASVSVTKTVSPQGLTGWSFGFTIFPVPAGEVATKTATPGTPTVAWTGLQPGTTYTVVEVPVPGFTAGPFTCSSGGPTFTPGPGEAVACSVTNTADAVIAPEEEVDNGTVGGTEDEEIADTGADVLPLVAVALWAALLGGLLLLVSHRRRA